MGSAHDHVTSDYGVIQRDILGAHAKDTNTSTGRFYQHPFGLRKAVHNDYSSLQLPRKKNKVQIVAARVSMLVSRGTQGSSVFNVYPQWVTFSG